MARVGYVGRAGVLACLAAATLVGGLDPAAATKRYQDRVTIDWRTPTSTFRPADVFGIAVDGGPEAQVSRLFLPANRKALRDLGGLRTSYRLRTELGIEAWHWSSHGRWSDMAHQQGYWTGDPKAAVDRIGFGYRLARRGDTHDEANDDGYSRLDDGDAATFWKSNPYLDARFTGIAGDHRDWLIAEWPEPRPIDAITIHWADPYAVRFEVQYWIGRDEYSGHWAAFPRGVVSEGRGGVTTLRLADAPIRTRFVRVLMTRSSHTAPAGATDERDAIGYAVAEIALGQLSPSGQLDDAVRHGRDARHQTAMHVSSTDPWHRASDRDPDAAQPSPVALRQAGVMPGGPVMLPVGILYDTPENMLALIEQLERNGVALDRVELGEEPDGQLIGADDYGALYLEFARLIRSRYPRLEVGGPSLVNGVSDTWLDADPDSSWTSRFIKYLKSRDALDQLDFFSYEYFPFDNVCGSAAAKLRSQTAQMRDLYARLEADGVPSDIPWFITELGYSAFGGAPLVQMPSALATADIFGGLLQRDAQGIFAYGITPSDLISGEKRCAGRGDLMFWLADRHGRASWTMPSLRALNLLTKVWTDPAGGPHRIFPVRSILRDREGRALVSAYAVQRPDARWSLLLVNRSWRRIRTRIAFGDARAVPGGHVDVAQYSADQYRWADPADGGHPSRDRTPSRHHIRDWSGSLALPRFSISVLTGNWRGWAPPAMPDIDIAAAIPPSPRADDAKDIDGTNE
ncbi:hypothetical protein [Sphingomonas sp. MMS24-J13]|uniref:hypothetical protein n=1 Tax=Sphingomonas sp. MMS24-J13 TaxID=3238686 RepID=UPI00384ECD05